MLEDTLQQRPERHCQQCAPDAIQVLSGDENENHQTRVNVRRSTDDLWIEEIGFHLVHTQNPEQSPEADPETLCQSNQYGRHGADDGSKYGDQTSDSRNQGHHRPILQVKHRKPDGRKHAIDAANQELAPHHARETPVDSMQKPVETRPRLLGHHRSKKADDSLARVHQVASHHQGHEQQKDAVRGASNDEPPHFEQLQSIGFQIVEHVFVGARQQMSGANSIDARLLVRLDAHPTSIRLHHVQACPNVHCIATVGAWSNLDCR